jgi:hypothetical protein
MGAFDHTTDSDHRERDDAEREWPSDRPDHPPLPPLSLLEQFELQRELERMLGAYQPPSVDDYYCY